MDVRRGDVRRVDVRWVASVGRRDQIASDPDRFFIGRCPMGRDCGKVEM